MSINSKYLQDKALAIQSARESESLKNSYQIEKDREKQEAEDFISTTIEEFSEYIDVEKVDISDSDIIDYPKTYQEKVEFETSQEDLTLTDNEKRLTPKQRKFARIMATKKFSPSEAAKSAGYSPNCASREAYKMMRNETVQAVIKERIPSENKLENLDENYLIERLLKIADKAESAIPFLDRDGNPTGVYSFNGDLAVKALDKIASIKGFDKGRGVAKKVSESTVNSNIIEGQVNEVKLLPVDILNIAEKIKKKQKGE